MHTISPYIMLSILFFGIFVKNVNAELVAHWNFNEGSGSTLYDSSGYSNDGTIYGATWEYEPLTGGALRFDGNNDYILVPHSPSLDVTGKITITAWVYPESMPGWCPHVVGKMVKQTGDQWRGSYWMTLNGNSSRNWGFSLSTNPGNIDYWASQNAPINEWSLLTATFDESLNEIKLYLNGILIDTFSENNGLEANQYPVYIGRNNDFNSMRYFKGLIGDIKIYNHVDSTNLYNVVVGQYLDVNGDGILDSIAAFFDRTVDTTVFEEMIFTFNWPDINGNVTTMTVDASDFTLFNGVNAGWKVTGYNLKQYVTSLDASWGHATIIQPDGNTDQMDTMDITDKMSDKMGPVIIGAKYYSFNSTSTSDTLAVFFSEKMSAIAERYPFRFWTPSNPSYLVEVDDVTTDSNAITFYVVDFTDNITSPSGDSIWIYADHDVKDAVGIEQMVDDNKKQPLNVFNAFNIQSATYLETDARPDGYIDLIRVTIKDSVPDNFDFSNLTSAITLPAGRNFAALTIGSFTATASGFDISVVQLKTDDPNTAVDAGDKLIISKNIEIGNNSVILPTSTDIADGLAPVVIKGTFCPKKELNNPDLFDSLIVTFTENVEVPSSKEPFKFFDISGTFPNDYTMTLTPLDNTPKAEMKFKVDNVEKLYPENGDSLWIAGGNNIEDIISIAQGKDTKPSPLIVKPYPLILAVTTLNPVSLGNLTIHNDLVNKFNLGKDNEGALIIIDISGNIENPAGLSGELDVLDAVGNIVTRDIKAKYVEYIENNNKHSALVMVWDVRNRNGRLVGPAPYCGIVIIKNGNTVVENKRILIGVQN